MMMSDLISEMKSYCDRSGTAASTLGRRALGDPSFVSRLRGGGECLPRTVEKVRAYMRANPPAASKAEAQSA
jgi:hypothetical protein